MSADQAGLIKAISNLGVGVAALLLVGGALYLQTQERRFEADRADRDREMVMMMLRESVADAARDRKTMRERGDQFVANQATFIEQQERLVTAIETQAALLKGLKAEQVRATEVMEQTLRTETQILIDAIDGTKK